MWSSCLKFLSRINVCWCIVAVCCAESDMLVPELLYESVLPLHLLSRPQTSCLISAWLWWTHAPSVLGRTVFWGNSTKTATVIGSTHCSDPRSQLSKTTDMYMLKHTSTDLDFAKWCSLWWTLEKCVHCKSLHLYNFEKSVSFMDNVWWSE